MNLLGVRKTGFADIIEEKSRFVKPWRQKDARPYLSISFFQKRPHNESSQGSLHAPAHPPLREFKSGLSLIILIAVQKQIIFA